jgi:hypothetical protein
MGSGWGGEGNGKAQHHKPQSPGTIIFCFDFYKICSIVIFSVTDVTESAMLGRNWWEHDDEAYRAKDDLDMGDSLMLTEFDGKRMDTSKFSVRT